jgi:D-apionolactonase
MKRANPTRAIKLYGTEHPDTSQSAARLAAGPLSLELDNGALRYIRLNGIEVLRAIAFLVRDENWGTYAPEISDLQIDQGPDNFRVRYHARCARPGQELSYVASIAGNSDGSLKFAATATAHSDFLTNRTGFVVLHPLKGVAGCAVRVLHVDGSEVVDRFPESVNPVQPFLDIRALSHEVAPGLWATCRMDGDTFEMEDHRNWTDASYKTYVRPLALPWPYTIPAAEEISQAVSLTFNREVERSSTTSSSAPVRIEVGMASAGVMPLIGIGVPAEESAASLAEVELIKAVAPQLLVCQFDPRRGHEAALLRRYKKLAEAIDADVVLEIVLPGVEEPGVEIKRVAEEVRRSRLELSAVAVSPAADLKSVLPGSVGAKAPSLESIYLAARAAFPGIRLGGGMFSFFTELNRKRPPATMLDFVTHTTCPIVHAADDRSVMETLESLPYVVRTARDFIGSKAYRVGPSSIGPRDNPHGATAADNPGNERICLAKMDPRQRGLFGAAWILGYVTALARGGLEAVILGSATGPAGLIYRKADYPQPYYDDLRGPAVHPAFHVVAGLTRAAGRARVDAASSNPGAVECLAHRVNSGLRLWLANLTALEQTLRIDGLPMRNTLVRKLDADAFVAATTNQGTFSEAASKSVGAAGVVLGPYAVQCLEVRGE